MALFVVRFVLLCLFYHAIDFVLGEAAAGLDGDFLLFAGTHILGGNFYNAVGINVESNFNARHPPRCRGNIRQGELAHAHIVCRHGTLALQNVYFHGGLIVHGGGKFLALRARNGGVAFDKGSKHAAGGFDAQRQGSNVQEGEFGFDFACQHAAL